MEFESDPPHQAPNSALTAIMGERDRLLGIAYRLLGSVTEAEDAVQEAYTRWYTMSDGQRDAIESPGAWLTTVTSRICLDVLRSARARRERYVGEWLPEPLPTPTEWTADGAGALPTDPADRITLDESVNMAFLVILESMTPAERVAFILHDVFHYSFAEIAKIVGRTPPASRQLASSARRRIRLSQGPATSHDRQADAVRGFKQAWDAKDIEALVHLLAPDATAIADGGGLVRSALHPVEGAEQIARSFIRLALRKPGMTLHETTVNGQPGLIGQEGGKTVTVYAFGMSDGRIAHIWGIRNPEKLQRWTGS